jgi:hypothetical protein
MWCYIYQDFHQRYFDANNHTMRLVLYHSLDKCIMDVKNCNVPSFQCINFMQVSISASANTVGELASSLVM